MDLTQEEKFEYFYENSICVLQSTFCNTQMKEFCYNIIKQEYITNEQFIEFSNIIQKIKDKELEYLFNEEIYQRD